MTFSRKLFWLLTLLPFSVSAQTTELERDFTKLSNEQKADTFMVLGRTNLRADKQLAAQYLTLARNYALRSNDSVKWAASMAMSGFAMPDSLPDSSLWYYENAIPTLVKYNHKYQVQALANAASMRLTKGDYEISLKYNQMATDYAREIGNSYLESTTLSNIAIVFDRMQDFDQAERYARKSIQVAVLNSDSAALGPSYMRMAVIKNRGSKNPEQTDSNIFYNRLAIDVYTDLGRDDLKGQVLGNLANSYVLAQNYEMALTTVNEAITLNEKFGREHSLSNNYVIKGSAEFNLGKFEQAVEDALLGADLAAKTDGLEIQSRAYHLLSEIFSAKGDLVKSMDYLERYTDLKQQLFKEEQAQAVAELQVRFETAEKERAIAELNASNAVKDLEITKSQQQIWLLFFSGIILAGGLIFFIVYLRKIQQTALQKKELAFQEQLISSQIESQENERQRIAKELHDGVAQSLTSIKMKMQFDLLKEKKEDPELEESIDLLGNVCNEVRSISHQMMPNILKTEGLVPAMRELLNQSLKYAQIEFDFESNSVEKSVLSQAAEITLYRISQEAINNIVKHSSATRVEVSLRHTGSHVELKIIDNGVGVDDEKSTKGIGLANMRARVKNLNGEMNLSSPKTGGLALELKLPV